MTKFTLLKYGMLSVSLVGLSGCGLASLSGGYTPIEQQTVSELSGANYVPRTSDERAAILTQDLFAQTAFWSREYDLNPADLEAAINLASTLRRLGNPQKSIEVSKQTRSLYPRDVDLMTELAASLVASNQPKIAIKHLDTALQRRPRQARLWSLKGAALDQLEQFKLAREHYSRAIRITPNDSGILTNIGLSYALEGDPATAEIWLRRAVNIPSASENARQNLALILGIQGKANEAEQWISQDLDKPAAQNNIDYLRSLRGPSNTGAQIGAQTARNDPRYPAPQNFQPQQQRRHAQNTYAPTPHQSPARRSNTDIAKPQNQVAAPIPAAGPQNLLERIAQSNRSKRAIARQQQQLLSERSQINNQPPNNMQPQPPAYAAQQNYIPQQYQQRAPYSQQQTPPQQPPYFQPNSNRNAPVNRKPARTRRY